jgi:hypothetical protein
VLGVAATTDDPRLEARPLPCLRPRQGRSSYPRPVGRRQFCRRQVWRLRLSPSPEDTIVSKSLRLADKDRDFIELYHKFRPIDPVLMRQRLMAVEGQHPEIIERAARFFETLPTSDAKKQQDPWKAVQRYMPDYPSDTHCAFYNAADNSVIIRKWDPALEIYNKVDNPLGPAVAGKNIEKYFVGGRAMDYDGWVAETSPTDEVGEDMGLSEVPSWKLG